MDRKRVLISGGGIAGLTLAILLKERGWEPLVIERDPRLRTEGYMMDFFGTGWDVAERMDLVDALRAIRYPIDRLDYVDARGRAYISIPIERIKKALHGKYVYLRRSDLERVLFERARALNVAIRFGLTIEAVEERGSALHVIFHDGEAEDFALLFGADGAHSRVRELVFGPEMQFSRYVGYYVAAFHLAEHDFPIDCALKLYEEPDRLESYYPLDDRRVDATYAIRHPDIGFIPPDRRLGFLKKHFRGSGYLAERVLRDFPSRGPIYFDAQTQIVMPRWQRGRVALIGDACGCLTLLAGQGSHMAMAGAYVLARELERNPDHRAAFEAYEGFLKPPVTRKQKIAARFSKTFVPTARSNRVLRRFTIRLMFTRPLLDLFFRAFGSKSILPGRYPV
jgi:2-polyprenyl-6-methoxyphenol hydroxylase-like FAD-dependent oxidoreductase